MKKKSLFVLWMATAVTGCGGGSAPSGESVAVSPAQTPTPISAPPTSAPAVRYYAEGASAIVSRLDFFDTGLVPAETQYTGFASYYTNVSGEFYISQTDRIRAGAFVPQKILTSDAPVNAIAATGIDHITNMLYFEKAAKGSTVISPFTSLIYEVGDQDLVQYYLQMTAGQYSLLDKVDLPSFSRLVYSTSGDTTKAALANHVSAAAIRLLVVEQAVNFFIRGSLATSAGSESILSDPKPLAAYIRSKPAEKIFGQGGTAALLRMVASDYQRSTYRPAVLAAYANMIDKYAAAVGTSIGRNEQLGQFALGVRGYLLPALNTLLQDNSDAAAAAMDAVSVEDIQASTLPFQSLPVTGNGPLFACTDFLLMPASGTLVISGDLMPTSSVSLTRNDLLFEDVGISQGFAQSIVSVSVPDRYRTALNVTLGPDKSVTVQKLGNFKGVAYFDYEEVISTNKATGRAFVIVN
jgi:hypothetical protein